MLGEIIEDTAAGSVQTVACGGALGVEAALATLELSRRAGGALAMRRVVRTWDEIPDLDRILDDLLVSVAAAAWALWPDWYPQLGMGMAPHVESVVAAVPRVSRPWLEAASRRCEHGRHPTDPSMARAAQAVQLALALGDPACALILATGDEVAPPHRVLALAKGAEWMATNGGMRVIVLCPEALLVAPALDPIAYGAIRLPSPAPRTPSTLDDETGRRTVGPILGRPHPLSPGEQLLARELARDAELGALFAFNQPVVTRHGSRHVVDLLWDGGRVVVEVDGFQSHSGRVAFNHDRHRDYELLTSGYLVLRLPHDEVQDDPLIALEKVRDVVRMRGSRPPR